nr:MAG: nonstructural protein [Microviridae sp.]
MGLKELFEGKEVIRIKNLYAIYDTKTELHAPPVVFENDGEALRSVMQYLQNAEGNTPMHKFPNDFVLLQVGKWEEKSGKVYDSEKKIIANCGELIQRAKQ